MRIGRKGELGKVKTAWGQEEKPLRAVKLSGFPRPNAFTLNKLSSLPEAQNLLPQGSITATKPKASMDQLQNFGVFGRMANPTSHAGSP